MLVNFMDFLSITNQELDSLDLSFNSQKIKSEEYKNYFLEKSGKEHYRLLTHISNSFEKIHILDIGTLKGCSALAFSSNEKNKVFSFNLHDELDLNQKPSNIEFIVDNVLKVEYKSLILSSSFIMLDTFHDGGFENEFYEYLKTIEYKGHLLLDDIHLNNNMDKFWTSIDKPKNDITNIGHVSGTGVVYFE